MRGRGLSDEEREEISRGIAAEESGRGIALRLGRHYSVINREVARCGGRAGYRSAQAVVLRVERARRPKTPRLVAYRRWHDAVAEGLALAWSPKQISARLKVEHPGDAAMRVSHETIYQTLFCQARGELATQLKLALRSGRTRRVPRGSTRPKQARIAGMVTISERPAEAADRAVPGHWEGDLIIGARGKSQIITLVERTTGYLMLGRVPYDRTADRVALILGTPVPRLPRELWRSLTWTRAWRWPPTPRSASKAASRCSSPTRTPRGSVAATRTPTGCSASTSPKARTCQLTPKPNLTRSPCNSTDDPANDTTGKPPPKCSNRYSRQQRDAPTR